MPTEQASSTTDLFVGRLENLDAGNRARLKRSAGKTLAEARNVLGLFFSLLPKEVQPYEESMYFLTATLFPMAQSGTTGNLGQHLKHALTVANAKGLDKRVEVLLDADAVQLPYRLRRAVAFLQSERIRVNWRQLLEDLLRWNRPDRPTQKKWARSYFTAFDSKKEE
jgi:CRISPR type I-E-associated protein CasB/Cse2